MKNRSLSPDHRAPKHTDAEGECLGAVTIVQDITERRERELELEQIHRQLVDASRQAGMADVATSVNVSATLLTEQVAKSRIGGLSRVAAMLQEHGDNLGAFISTDERGKRLPASLTQLATQLTAEQSTSLAELAELAKSIEHIKEIVRMQQGDAKLCGVTETVQIADLVDDSLRMNDAALARHGVTVRREFAPVPAVTVDKHKVLHILVNLVRNAKYACDESPRSEKCVTVRVERCTAGVRIAAFR